MKVIERSIIAIVILFIILEQNFSKHSFYKMSQFRKLTHLGTITYGLYCLHFIAILITIKTTALLRFNDSIWQVLILETIVSLLLSIFISKMSYRYFESYFLKFKDRFAIIKK